MFVANIKIARHLDTQPLTNVGTSFFL